jgi:hypothetical protein
VFIGVKGFFVYDILIFSSEVRNNAVYYELKRLLNECLTV